MEKKFYYNKNIFGFATSNTFTYFDVNSNEFKEKIDKISPKILRFPGGAVGNFYHFDGSAYGMKINEIDSLILGKFPKRARGLISYSKRKKHTKNRLHKNKRKNVQIKLQIGFKVDFFS